MAQAQVVNLGCCEFFADDNGNFEFYLPTGDYTVNVSSPSTFLGTTSFSVTDGLATDVGVVDFGG